MLESSTARSTNCRVAGYPGHWSSCMQMSAPSFSAMAMLSSGDQNTRRPSYSTARKATPSFVSFMNSPWEKTWNPPESVRMGPFQRMNS